VTAGSGSGIPTRRMRAWKRGSPLRPSKRARRAGRVARVAGDKALLQEGDRLVGVTERAGHAGQQTRGDIAGQRQRPQPVQPRERLLCPASHGVDAGPQTLAGGGPYRHPFGHARRLGAVLRLQVRRPCAARGGAPRGQQNSDGSTPNANGAGATALWSFNEGTGGTVADGTGQYSGTVVGSPQWVPGFSGKALHFQRSISNGVMQSSLAGAGAPFSLEAKPLVPHHADVPRVGVRPVAGSKALAAIGSTTNISAGASSAASARRTITARDCSGSAPRATAWRSGVRRVKKTRRAQPD
jgi:hypothetical protein